MQKMINLKKHNIIKSYVIKWKKKKIKFIILKGIKK